MKKTARVLSIAVLLSAARQPDSAPAHIGADQAVLDARVDAYLRDVIAAGDFNGVVLIAKGDSMLVAKHVGVSDITTRKANALTTRFRIASVTKTFSAAAISVLADEGKLRYTDTLSRFLPEFPNAGRITIRQLLLHSSGVPNPRLPACERTALDALVRDIAALPLTFEPGARSQYSNGGYVILARVVEVASGISWEQFLQRRLFAPVGLQATGVDQPSAPSARGHVPDQNGMTRTDCAATWGALGSGALTSTAPDLHRWARAVRSNRLFDQRALEHPYGWGARRYHDRRVIEQSGTLGGSSSYVAAYLDDDVYVVILANLQTGILTQMGIGLGALMFDRDPAPLVASPATVAWVPSELKRWVGRFHSAQVTTVTLIESGGSLRLRWADSPETVHIAATGPSSAYNKLDGIAMTLSANGDTLRMRWGTGDPIAFPRTNAK